jgi:uncharacterized OB-fold protein
VDEVEGRGSTAESPAAPVEALATSRASEPFWKALAAGRLELPFCLACEAPFFYPRQWCPACWSHEISWRPVEGVGTVWALSTVHLAFQGIPETELPYTVVLVDLDAGVRLPGRLSDARGPIAVGDRVRLVFADDPARDLPTFQAVS